MNSRIPTRSQQQAMEWSLVLISQGIESLIEHSDEAGWNLRVADQHYTPALRVLQTYRRENTRWGWRQTIAPGGLLLDWSSVAWVILIAVFYWLSDRFPPMREAGLMSASDLSTGEWWRLFTAMFLHADLAHLAANGAIGCVLLALVMGRFGPGAGLLAASLAGAGGNAITWFFDPGHRSLGASGLAMGCVGLLAAQSFSGARRSPLELKYLISGLSGGIMLFVLTGLSPGTDVLAHFGGFVSGVALGIVLSLQSTVLQRRDVNALAGVAFGGLTLLTWSLALRGD
jgi:membrane associated rhomboid family serine protease